MGGSCGVESDIEGTEVDSEIEEDGREGTAWDGVSGLVGEEDVPGMAW